MRPSKKRDSSFITDGNCEISGFDTYAEAEEIAMFIRIGALGLKLEVLEAHVIEE